MTDYRLSKLFFDLQDLARAAEYRRDPGRVLARYNLKPEVQSAVLADDVAYLARLTNPYLLRYFFSAVGMSDEEFIDRLRQGAEMAGKAASRG